MDSLLRRASIVAALGMMLFLTGCGGGSQNDNPPGATVPTSVVQPLPLPGPYAVACSNVAQDFARVPEGANAKDYWEGTPSASGAPRYISDLLVDPPNAVTANVVVPNDRALYGAFAANRVPFVVLVCYPTTVDNPRPDYALPTGKVVPHMQTGAEAPLFANSAVRYPVLAFSHGYSGSPISNDYITALYIFASYGYVVVAPFHGDPRFSDLKIDDLGDVIAVVAHLDNFTALQALRPLSVSAALDILIASPQWQSHIDPAQIGAFGASMGGETVMLLGGAGLTSSAGLSWTQVTLDPRIKAAAGYVPYFGQPFLPAFGRDEHGLDGVKLPFLGISGTADLTAPIIETQLGVTRLAGARELVALAGVKHGFDVASAGDIFTWMLVYFDAEVRGNPAARQQLSTMASVAGGGDDSVVIYYDGPTMSY